MDNAYWLWTFQGRLLQKNNKDRFCQLLWRPRPPTLLSTEQIKVQFLLYTMCVCVVECVEPVMTNIIFLTPRMRAAPWLLILALIWGSQLHHIIHVSTMYCDDAFVKPSVMLTCCHIHSSVLLQMIKKDLKKYSKIFEQKDRLSQSKASKVWPVYIYILTYVWESLLEMLFPIFHVLSPTSSISIG